MKKFIKVALLVLIVLAAVVGVVLTFTPETAVSMVEPIVDSLAMPADSVLVDSTAMDVIEPVVDSLGL